MEHIISYARQRLPEILLAVTFFFVLSAIAYGLTGSLALSAVLFLLSLAMLYWNLENLARNPEDS